MFTVQINETSGEVEAVVSGQVQTTPPSGRVFLYVDADPLQTGDLTLRKRLVPDSDPPQFEDITPE